MARPTLYNPRQRGNSYLYPDSSPQFINGADLDNATLQSGEYITIWSEDVKADTLKFFGFGPRNREAADASFAYCELLADGSGTGADGDQISGKLRLAIVDSTGDDIRRRVFGDLDDLADAKSDSRTDRPMQAEVQPAASQDKSLALQVKVDASDDGVVVGNDSNVKLHYGLYSGA
jgi:hypothetical protein